MLESEFKREFIEKLIKRLEVPLHILNYEGRTRSLPDAIILGPTKWAALEFKRSKSSPRQPNQAFHIKSLNDIGYATFVYPENEEGVLNDLEKLFSS